MNYKITLLREWAPPRHEQFVAYVLLFFLLFEIPGLSFVPISFIPALGLSLIGAFTPTVKRVVGLSKMLMLSAFAVLSGLTLRAFEIPDSRPSSAIDSFIMIAWMVSIPMCVILGIWCLERVDLMRGLGVMLVGAVLSSFVGSDSFSWKGTFGIYVTLALLIAFFRSPRFMGRIILLVSMGLSIAFDSRMMAGFCLAVFLLTLLNGRQHAWIGSNPKKATAILVCMLIVTFNVGVSAMVNGFLGEQIQARTISQIAKADNVIIGGRTEWAATIDLFQSSPFGYGVAVSPSSSDIGKSLEAVRAVGGDYSNSYYWEYLVFGDRLDLHSMAADMWSHFSVGGVAFTLAVFWFVIRATPLAVACLPNVGAGMLLAIFVGGWDLLFSPMGNSERLVTSLIVAFALLTLQSNRNRLPAEVIVQKK